MSIVPQQLQYTPPTDDGNGGVSVDWVQSFLSMLQKTWGLLVQTLRTLVSGPTSSVAGNLASFADSTGLVLQDSGVSSMPQAWQTPTLLNSWVNVGPGYSEAGYYKDPFGRIWLRGLLRVGASGTVIFTLPSGYRPAAEAVFGIDCLTSAYTPGELDVRINGDVIPTFAGVLNNFSLNGLSFDTRA